jgi:hypothetical protein
MTKTKNLLLALSKGIEAVLTKMAGNNVRFALIVWEDRGGGKSKANYVSNALRSDVRDAMKEMVDRWDTADHEKNEVKSDLN